MDYFTVFYRFQIHVGTYAQSLSTFRNEDVKYFIFYIFKEISFDWEPQHLLSNVASGEKLRADLTPCLKTKKLNRNSQVNRCKDDQLMVFSNKQPYG